jgi:enamine deaminase RidA (YjgF/YER057c/UK114 family)
MLELPKIMRMRIDNPTSHEKHCRPARRRSHHPKPLNPNADTAGGIMADIRIFNPDGLNKPRSPYMQVARVRASELAFIAGQVSVDGSGDLVGPDDFEAQCARVFANIHAALRSVGAEWNNVVEFTSFLVRPQDVPAFVAYRHRVFPSMFPNGAYPPNTLLVIDRLAHDAYLLEVQTVAAL